MSHYTMANKYGKRYALGGKENITKSAGFCDFSWLLLIKRLFYSLFLDT